MYAATVSRLKIPLQGNQKDLNPKPPVNSEKLGQEVPAKTPVLDRSPSCWHACGPDLVLRFWDTPRV